MESLNCKENVTLKTQHPLWCTVTLLYFITCESLHPNRESIHQLRGCAGQLYVDESWNGHLFPTFKTILTTETFSWTMQPCLNPNMFE